MSYPKAVIFVLLSKFFEAFAANGVRSMNFNTIISNFFTQKLTFNRVYCFIFQLYSRCIFVIRLTFPKNRQWHFITYSISSVNFVPFSVLYWPIAIWATWEPYFISFFCTLAVGLEWWSWLYHSKTFRLRKIHQWIINSLNFEFRHESKLNAFLSRLFFFLQTICHSIADINFNWKWEYKSLCDVAWWFSIRITGSS